jgi:hypothetical protein
MSIQGARSLGHYATLPAGVDRHAGGRAGGPPEPPKPRLLDRVRQAIGTRHYSRRTEKAGDREWSNSRGDK